MEGVYLPQKDRLMWLICGGLLLSNKAAKAPMPFPSFLFCEKFTRSSFEENPARCIVISLLQPSKKSQIRI